MTPYYDDGQCVIYHGDSDEVLPALDVDVDLILTDPPYNVSERNGRDGTTVGKLKRKDGTARKVWRDFGGWDKGWNPEPFLEQVPRLLVDGGSLVAFTSEFLMDAYLQSGLNHRSVIYWVKTNPTPAFRQLYVRAVEMAIWQAKGKGGWTFNGGGYTLNVLSGPIVAGHACANGETRVHPTQKPLWLMEQLVDRHSNPGHLLLDPFMGSGTTLAAAKKHGRRVIGVELEERYCEIAANRLAQGVLDFGGAAMNRVRVRYVCPRCGKGVTLTIQPVAPPECACRPGRVTTTMQPQPDGTPVRPDTLDLDIRAPGECENTPRRLAQQPVRRR